jgi:hypothetical protein
MAPSMHTRASQRANSTAVSKYSFPPYTLYVNRL